MEPLQKFRGRVVVGSFMADQITPYEGDNGRVIDFISNIRLPQEVDILNTWMDHFMAFKEPFIFGMLRSSKCFETIIFTRKTPLNGEALRYSVSKGNGESGGSCSVFASVCLRFTPLHIQVEHFFFIFRVDRNGVNINPFCINIDQLPLSHTLHGSVKIVLALVDLITKTSRYEHKLWKLRPESGKTRS